MAKQGMSRPSTPHGPKNETSPVPQIQGKAKSGKEKANPIITGTIGANQKVWHEKPISKAHVHIPLRKSSQTASHGAPFP